MVMLGDAEQAAFAQPTKPVPGQPDPHILPFAEKPNGEKKGPGDKNKKVTFPVSVDGCDHRYGTAGQCVPWTFPAGIKDKERCDWLGKRGLASLKLVGEDRLNLDRNRDGIACGKGD
ncbi:hypothetical protein GCM10011591_06590 [Nocardia camponoti]|uniref:Excalibur calcium-binding domain-containing protein n=2 Tax=Nocardia camponoti TaxID=1616106 RepID=A0A917V497_9NOCA|nr:hypothetical protein GCM10011591_06590 [Nocardia camponoti]